MTAELTNNNVTLDAQLDLVVQPDLHAAFLRRLSVCNMCTKHLTHVLQASEDGIDGLRHHLGDGLTGRHVWVRA